MSSSVNATQSGSPWRHTLSLQSAAALSTFVFYPLDTIKFRIMAQNGTANRAYHLKKGDFTSIRQAICETYIHEGIFTFYRGCSLAVFGSTFSWGIYMLTYKHLQKAWEDFSATSLSPSCWSTNMLIMPYVASLFASVVTAFASNPIWLIKIRMQLQETSSTGCNRHFYRGFSHGMSAIWKSEGMRGLFRGVSAQIILTVPNSLFMPMYEMMKQTLVQWQNYHKNDISSSGLTTRLTPFETALCTVLAKVTVAVVSNPILIVKTKMQDHRASNEGHPRDIGFLRTMQRTIATEGFLKGLCFRGLGANVLQTTPRAVVHILLYEMMFHSTIFPAK